MQPMTSFNSSFASGDFCPLLITFANSLNPYQDQQNVCPDLDPNHLTLWKCYWNIFWEKLADDNKDLKSMQS